MDEQQTPDGPKLQDSDSSALPVQSIPEQKRMSISESCSWQTENLFGKRELKKRQTSHRMVSCCSSNVHSVKIVLEAEEALLYRKLVLSMRSESLLEIVVGHM